MVKSSIKRILNEINQVFENVNEDEVRVLIREILNAEKVVTIGAGRVGLVAKAFAMRLMHLGMKAYTLGDSNLTKIGKKDLLIVCSGSGETQTIYDLTKISKKKNIKIALITGNNDSRIGRIANYKVLITAPTKLKKTNIVKSIQPMTTLMEQCLYIFFDGLILEIMKKLNINSDKMKNNHSILE